MTTIQPGTLPQFNVPTSQDFEENTRLQKEIGKLETTITQIEGTRSHRGPRVDLAGLRSQKENLETQRQPILDKINQFGVLLRRVYAPTGGSVIPVDAFRNSSQLHLELAKGTVALKQNSKHKALSDKKVKEQQPWKKDLKEWLNEDGVIENKVIVPPKKDGEGIAFEQDLEVSDEVKIPEAQKPSLSSKALKLAKKALPVALVAGATLAGAAFVTDSVCASAAAEDLQGQCQAALKVSAPITNFVTGAATAVAGLVTYGFNALSDYINPPQPVEPQGFFAGLFGS